MKKRLLLWSVAVLAVVLAVAMFAYMSHRPKDPDDVAGVVRQVNQHYMLPVDETPALATVTDTTKLSSAIFRQASNGDRVLIYQKNHLAVIYRPSIDRVVTVGPVSIDTPKGGIE